MSKEKRTTFFMVLSGVFSLMLLSTLLSFAYFSAVITGVEDSTTIFGAGGQMLITYAGGETLNMENMSPREEAWGTKNFTLTGNNSTSGIMEYNITLVVTKNTFTNGALKYKLISENTDENGEVAPSIIGLKDIKNGPGQIQLGNGHFTGPTEGEPVHSYSLEIYFPDTGIPQDEDQGKEIEAYVSVSEGAYVCEDCLANKILTEFGGIDNIQEAPEGAFASKSGSEDFRLYKAKDDYGDSYYFRGAKDHVNNNLIFAEHQWKIVRINGDGSIRIIYNGTCPGNDCTINSTGITTQMGGTTVKFNSSDNDNKYVGYMYGYASVPTLNYQEAHKNEVNSTIKTYLDTWYTTNILGTPNESYISDTLFCGDRELHTGTGLGAVETFYKAENRLRDNKKPSLKCTRQNDRFTVGDTFLGNGALTYPIGLLTADEAAMAGLLVGTGNSTNYLYTNQNFWLMSPSRFDSYAIVFYVHFSSNIDLNLVNYPLGARGVLNLKSETTVTGTGTTSDPYVVN